MSFRKDNTIGYSAADLERLNQVLEARLEARDLSGLDEDERKAVVDHVSEEILAAFDIGRL